VIPILVGGATMPPAGLLPRSIRALARRHAVGLRPERFRADCQALVTALRAQLLGAEAERAAAEANSGGHGAQQTVAIATSGQRAAAEQAYLAEGRIKVDAMIVHGAPGGWFKPGAGKVEWFKDAEIGPELVVVPAERPFAIGRFALTFKEWDAAQARPEWQANAGIDPRKANDFSWGRGRRPAIDVSWYDARAYCLWLSKVTSKSYRLPSEAEWELCCRAGTTTEFWWGDQISTEQANYNGNHPLPSGKKGKYRKHTVAVDSFEPNPWGLYQVHGNVWEWCEDQAGPSSRVLRGSSWDDYAYYLRSAFRADVAPDGRVNTIGFRVARTL